MNTAGFGYREPLQRALKFSGIVGGVTVIWVIVAWLQLLSPELIGTGSIILGAVLFVLSLPISVFVRLDTIQDAIAIGALPLLLVAASMASLNWTLWTMVTAYLRHWGILGKKRNKAERTSSPVKR